MGTRIARRRACLLLSGPLAATVVVAMAGLTLAAHQTLVYTTPQTMVLAATPGGRAVAHLQVATALAVTGKKGAYLQVTLTGWVRQRSPQVLYVDLGRGRVGSAIQAGRFTGATPKALLTTTDPTSGVVWEKVVVRGWVPATQTATSLTPLWATASHLYRTRCGVCHALYAPTAFTAQQWVGDVAAMGPRTALTPAQLALVLKYLQWHARDTVALHPTPTARRGKRTRGGAAATPQTMVALGRRIYEDGVGPDGHAIAYTGGMMMLHTCADCHGLDGHGRQTMMFTSPNITYGNLTRRGGMIEPDGSRGPRYTPALIARAVTRGIGADGQQLDRTMPRWRMTHQEVRDLISYLKVLH